MSRLDRRALLIAGAGTVVTAPLLAFEPAAAGSTTRKAFQGSFSARTKEDWVYLPLQVPKGVREIRVRYEYPEPIDTGAGYSTNVIDIGVFGPSGFRGWSGGARDHFKLSRTWATPGYVPGPITPGRWRIALGPYQVVSPIDYRVVVTLVHGTPGEEFEPEPAPTSVPGTGTGWYRGDLHVHTVHSDGSQTQRAVLRYAEAAGLDFIGTSEHNTSTATGTWGRYVPEGFLVVPGEEVTTRAGHWLATGVPSGTWVDWRYRPEDGRLAAVADEVRELGGLAIAAHPFVPVESMRWDFDPDYSEMDAVEVWNGPWSGINATFNSAAVRRWHELLTQGIVKTAVGNSDTHRESQTIGLPHNVVHADELSVEALVRALRAGRSWIAESSTVDLVSFTATLDDVSGEIGDRVPSDPGSTVAVHLDVTGVPGCVARLLGPGSTIFATVTADESGRIVVDREVPGGTAFVRAEVRRGASFLAGQTVALTNPILLTAAG